MFEKNESQETEGQFFESNQDVNQDLPKNLDEDLQTFIDSFNSCGDLSFTCTLYKFEHPKHGSRKEFCGQFEDETPSLEEIGNRYGGGRYSLYVVIYMDDERRNKKVKSYKFRISDYFNKSGDRIQAPQQQNNISDTLEVFKSLVAVISPLISKNDNSFASNQTLINTVLRDSAKNQLEMMKEFRQEIKQIKDDSDFNNVDEGDSYDEPEEDKNEMTGILSIVEPLLEKYLPLLLGNGPSSKIAIETVKNLPAFKTVTENSDELSALVEYIAGKEGKEAAKKLIKNLKIKTSLLNDAAKAILQ